MKYLLVLVLFVSSIMFAQDAVKQEKREIILQYILSDQLQGASESFFERQIQYVKQSHPDVPDSVWDDVRAHADGKTAFIDTVIQAYEAKLSLLELREIKDLYSKPIMLKMKTIGTEIGESFPAMAAACGRRNIMKRIEEYLENRKR